MLLNQLTQMTYRYDTYSCCVKTSGSQDLGGRWTNRKSDAAPHSKEHQPHCCGHGLPRLPVTSPSFQIWEHTPQHVLQSTLLQRQYFPPITSGKATVCCVDCTSRCSGLSVVCTNIYHSPARTEAMARERSPV